MKRGRRLPDGSMRAPEAQIDRYERIYLVSYNSIGGIDRRDFYVSTRAIKMIPGFVFLLCTMYFIYVVPTQEKNDTLEKLCSQYNIVLVLFKYLYRYNGQFQ